jgi:hypothetical protein
MERKLRKRISIIFVVKVHRAMFTAPILDEIEINLKQEKQILFPKSSIGIVINYALTIVENLK